MKPLPRSLQASIASRIKIMGGLDIAEKRLPQDGRIRLKIAGRDYDVRLSTLPVAFGERLVLRRFVVARFLSRAKHRASHSHARIFPRSGTAQAESLAWP